MIKGTLRTIPGVFCPVALSMCSVAVFMRIGKINVIFNVSNDFNIFIIIKVLLLVMLVFMNH